MNAFFNFNLSFYSMFVARVPRTLTPFAPVLPLLPLFLILNQLPLQAQVGPGQAARRCLVREVASSIQQRLRALARQLTESLPITAASRVDFTSLELEVVEQTHGARLTRATPSPPPYQHYAFSNFVVNGEQLESLVMN